LVVILVSSHREEAKNGRGIIGRFSWRSWRLGGDL
jgi:hypothetical protein